MNLKKTILFSIIIILFAASYKSGLWEYLTMDFYLKNRDSLLQYVNSNYLQASVFFIAIYIFTTALSIPGAVILTLTGGYVFGFAGIVHVNIGATAGATSAFLVSRYLAGDALQNKYGEKLTALNRELEKNGKNYMLMLRLIFLFPFFLLNIIAGLTKLPLYTFIWTTSLGIIPGSFAYIYAGRQINSLSSMNDILSFKLLSVFVLLAAIAAIPVVIQKIFKKGETV